MPLKSAQEWAEIYQTAIESIVVGTVASYSISGRTFTKLDLSALHDLYQYWSSRAQSDRVGFTTVADFRSEGQF